MNWSESITNRDIKVGVIGLGYVGLPLALAFAEADFEVTGFDVDPETVEQINSGVSPIPDLDSNRVDAVVNNNTLRASTDMSAMSEMDTLSICVPTPLRKTRDPDISYIVDVTESITEYFTSPGIIVLESTTYPGTTEEILAEKFQEHGWDLENELFLAFSPERIDPGNEEFGIRNTPKVLGGYSEEANTYASMLYGEIVNNVVEVSSAKAAEMVKLLENVFRSVNIGLANEMAVICDRFNVNVWEIIEAADTKPFGFMPFYPGPGLGGHCIPVDPLFLSWKAQLMDTNSHFIELADEINRSMPDFVCDKVFTILNEEKKCVNGSDICVFGVAYKPNVNDTRESPALEIIDQLHEKHANIQYCDPYVDELEINNKIFPSVSMNEVTGSEYDLGLILTDHDDFNWNKLLLEFPAVLDTRNSLSSFDAPDHTRFEVL